jgi:endonuclease/exonuclease/phosphatase family metal-dependent hydrolase
MGQIARLESAKLVRNQLDKLAKDCSVIITGDFNAGEGSKPYEALFANDSPVVDTYRSTHPAKQENEGTFSGFKSDQTSGARIDWIAVSKDWTILEAKIDHTAQEGRTPSDHFPVTAILQPNKK